MKKVITAIGNEILNKKIRESEEVNVVTEDITADESLLEWIEKEDEIDVLFLHADIIKNYSLEEYIDILTEIQVRMEIVLFCEKEDNQNIGEIERLKIVDKEELEIGELKKLLEETNEETEENQLAKMIAISGANGIGKSTFSTFFAKNVEKQNIKTLLIDFDLDGNQIKTLLKIKRQPQYDGDIKNLIININKNFDVLCHLDRVFSVLENNFFKIQKLINELKEEYDLIIIDTSSNLNNKYTKRIFYNCDDIIFLVEPNILGVKKAKTILEVFENDWNIPNKKISLILNKTNMYQISDSIMQELFSEFKIIGKMKYMDSYNLLINKNVNKKEIKKEYEKICKKVCK